MNTSVITTKNNSSLLKTRVRTELTEEDEPTLILKRLVENRSQIASIQDTVKKIDDVLLTMGNKIQHANYL